MIAEVGVRDGQVGAKIFDAEQPRLEWFTFPFLRRGKQTKEQHERALR
jgi:hypothetical protein